MDQLSRERQTGDWFLVGPDTVTHVYSQTHDDFVAVDADHRNSYGVNARNASISDREWNAGHAGNAAVDMHAGARMTSPHADVAATEHVLAALNGDPEAAAFYEQAGFNISACQAAHAAGTQLLTGPMHTAGNRLATNMYESDAWRVNPKLKVAHEVAVRATALKLAGGNEALVDNLYEPTRLALPHLTHPAASMAGADFSACAAAGTDLRVLHAPPTINTGAASDESIVEAIGGTGALTRPELRLACSSVAGLLAGVPHNMAGMRYAAVRTSSWYMQMVATHELHKKLMNHYGDNSAEMHVPSRTLAAHAAANGADAALVGWAECYVDGCVDGANKAVLSLASLSRSQAAAGAALDEQVPNLNWDGLSTLAESFGVEGVAPVAAAALRTTAAPTEGPFSLSGNAENASAAVAAVRAAWDDQFAAGYLDALAAAGERGMLGRRRTEVDTWGHFVANHLFYKDDEAALSASRGSGHESASRSAPYNAVANGGANVWSQLVAAAAVGTGWPTTHGVTRTLAVWATLPQAGARTDAMDVDNTRCELPVMFRGSHATMTATAGSIFDTFVQPFAGSGVMGDAQMVAARGTSRATVGNCVEDVPQIKRMRRFYRQYFGCGNDTDDAATWQNVPATTDAFYTIVKDSVLHQSDGRRAMNWLTAMCEMDYDWSMNHHAPPGISQNLPTSENPGGGRMGGWFMGGNRWEPEVGESDESDAAVWFGAPTKEGIYRGGGTGNPIRISDTMGAVVQRLMNDPDVQRLDVHRAMLEKLEQFGMSMFDLADSQGANVNTFLYDELQDRCEARYDERAARTTSPTPMVTPGHASDDSAALRGDGGGGGESSSDDDTSRLPAQPSRLRRLGGAIATGAGGAARAVSRAGRATARGISAGYSRVRRGAAASSASGRPSRRRGPRPPAVAVAQSAAATTGRENPADGCTWLVERPFKTFRMGAAILARGGMDLGCTFYGRSNFQWADNVVTKTHVGHFTCVFPLRVPRLSCSNACVCVQSTRSPSCATSRPTWWRRTCSSRGTCGARKLETTPRSLRRRWRWRTPISFGSCTRGSEGVASGTTAAR